MNKKGWSKRFMSLLNNNTNNNMGRKTQVTVFIIIGILMLMSIVLFLYLKVKIETDIKFADMDAPHEVAPVIARIETCLTDVSIEGLRKMGMKGGYIYPRQYGIKANPLNPTAENGVYLFPETDIIIPYWYHLVGTDCIGGKCNFETNIPLLYRISESPLDKSMQAQLELYIIENLKDCLGGINLNSLKDIGFSIREEGFLDASVYFTDVETIVNISWPLWLQNKGSLNEHTLDEFRIYIPGDIKNIYEHAVTITSQQMYNNYLEILTRFLIFGYQGKDPNRFPPYADSDFSLSGSVTWMKRDIQERIKNHLQTYIPMMQYYGSYSYKERNFGDDIFSNYIYNYLMTIPSKRDGVGRLQVDFMYLDIWEPYVELNCQGEVCKGESVTLFNFIPIGLQRYRFYYNVSYPVLVTLHDPYALDEGGFTLQFFLEANIRYNQPLGENFTAPAMYGEENKAENMFCKITQRNSGNITLNATDTAGNPLDEVQIIYTCGDVSCDLGFTDEKGIINTKFPICFDGMIKSYKRDYVGGSEYLTTELHKNDYISLVLGKEYEVGLDIQKKDYIAKEPYDLKKWIFNAHGVPLAEEEFAFINLNRIDKTGEFPINVIAQVKGKSNETEKINFAPGNYTAEVYVYSDKQFVIPERIIEVGEDTLFSSTEEVLIPRMEINSSFPIGQLFINFSVTEEDIANASILTLYVLTPNIHVVPEDKRVIEHMEIFNKFRRYNDEHLEYLQPVFTQKE
jgi:hypothetical protein